MHTLMSVLFLVLSLTVGSVNATPPGSMPENKAATNMSNQEQMIQSILVNNTAPSISLDPQKAYADYQIKNYRLDALEKGNNIHWENEAYGFNQRLHEAQLSYQAAIFVVVVVIVGAGLWFSFMQFTVERRRHQALIVLLKELNKLPLDSDLRKSAMAAFEANCSSAPHSLELGPFKFTSNVIGLIVLALSLAFFNIFIERVYTIQKIDIATDANSSTEKKQ